MRSNLKQWNDRLGISKEILTGSCIRISPLPIVKVLHIGLVRGVNHIFADLFLKFFPYGFHSFNPLISLGI